jgi:hypothetical protein
MSHSLSLCLGIGPLASLCSWSRWRAACDGCEAPLTRITGRMATPDGLGVLCVRCLLAHTAAGSAPADPVGIEAG